MTPHTPRIAAALTQIIIHARAWDAACGDAAVASMPEHERRVLIAELCAQAEDFGLRVDATPRVRWWSRLSAMFSTGDDSAQRLRQAESALLVAYERACETMPPMGLAGLLLRQYGDLRRAVLGRRAASRSRLRQPVVGALHPRRATS